MCLSERKKTLEESCSRLNYQPYNRQQPQQSTENSGSDSFMSVPNGNASAEGTPSFDINDRGNFTGPDLRFYVIFGHLILARVIVHA